MTKALFRAHEIACYTPDGKKLQSPCSFVIVPGDMLVVRGPNGVGKTTLVQALLGFHKNYDGKVESYLPKARVGYLPQLQNVMFHLPVTLRDILSMSGNWSGDESEVEKMGLLAQRHLDLAWNTASGGERKRTLITRALLSKPKLLVLDEPFNHLDTDSKVKVTHALEEYMMGGQEPNAIMMVSHENSHYEQLLDSKVNVVELELKKYAP